MIIVIEMSDEDGQRFIDAAPDVIAWGDSGWDIGNSLNHDQPVTGYISVEMSMSKDQWDGMYG